MLIIAPTWILVNFFSLGKDPQTPSKDQSIGIHDGFSEPQTESQVCWVFSINFPVSMFSFFIAEQPKLLKQWTDILVSYSMKFIFLLWVVRDLDVVNFKPQMQMVGYEEDLTGRQMIIDRVRTRSSMFWIIWRTTKEQM